MTALLVTRRAATETPAWRRGGGEARRGAYVSQTASLVDELGEEDLRRWWSTEAFVAAEPGLSETEAGVSRAVAASGGAR